VLFQHAECDFHTPSVIFTRRVWFQHARVWFLHAEYDFNTHECDFSTQSVISTRRSVISPFSISKTSNWILIENYITTNDTSEFFDRLSVSSAIELELGPSRSKGFFIIYFFLFALTQPFLNRIQHINRFWACCNKHFCTSFGPKKIIQNRVNI
jgi:hypothetical protein